MECIECGSAHTIKAGSWKTRGTGERRQRWECKDCGRRWTPGAVEPVKGAPDGYMVKGVSEYVRTETGAQWIKTDVSKAERVELLREAVAGIAKEWQRVIRPIPKPKTMDKDKLACIVWGDPHVGMYAWADEAGDDFDLDICTSHLYAATDELVESAPDCDECVIVNLGDFYHANTDENRTNSGHALDVDGRRAKVFRAGVAAFARCIHRALEKHKNVTVYITKGNHDDDLAFPLAEVLRVTFQNEPRVTIRGGIKAQYYHEWGTNLIGITHGHQAKPPNLPLLMAHDQSDAWGRTTCRRWFVGHLHHQDRKEYPGCIVEIFPTLAAKDAWHAAMGYRSERAMTCVIFDKEHGEVGRRIVGIKRVKEMAA